jgi:hypothetical protein
MERIPGTRRAFIARGRESGTSRPVRGTSLAVVAVSGASGLDVYVGNKDGGGFPCRWLS